MFIFIKVSKGDKNDMKNNNRSKKNIIAVTTVLLAVLLILDIIYQGEVYKRLPIKWQNKLSEWS